MKRFATILMAVPIFFLAGFHLALLQPVQAQIEIETGNEIFEELLNEGPNLDCDLPPVWNEPINTGSIHAFTINLTAKLVVNGILISPGDVIGGFYLDENGEEKCGGYDCLVGDAATIFPLFGDDPDTPEKDGFMVGEEVKFRFFSWTCNRECVVDSVRWDPDFINTNHWYPLGFSGINYMGSIIPFDCNLGPGYGFSFTEGWNEFTYPETKFGNKDFFRAFGKFILILNEKNGNGMYWPDLDIYFLELVPGKSYMIKTTQDTEIFVPYIK